MLHLHTKQFAQIDHELRSIFDEQKFRLIEGPFARTWDDEYREFFSSLVSSSEEPNDVHQCTLRHRLRLYEDSRV